MKIIDRLLHAWLWPIRGKMNRLHCEILEDRRWLASNPVAVALCDRYLEMLRDDWERSNIIPISQLRDQLEKMATK